MTSVVGVELDAVPPSIAEGGLAAEVEEAVGNGVAVVAVVAGGLAELVDDLRGGRVGGVAHAEVDDVDAGAAFTVFEVVDLAEEVGRQPLTRSATSIWNGVWTVLGSLCMVAAGVERKRGRARPRPPLC